MISMFLFFGKCIFLSFVFLRLAKRFVLTAFGRAQHRFRMIKLRKKTCKELKREIELADRQTLFDVFAAAEH